MTIYPDPPPWESFVNVRPTLLVSWWCSSFAATIILFRVVGRYIRSEKLFSEDWIAFACLIPLFLRMALVHVVLIYGTNNVNSDNLSDVEIHRRMIGSRLVLASRIFYAATLWMLKLTITEFFKRLTFQIWRRSYEIMLRTIRWFLLATFVAVVLADICECQPIRNYWQVVSNPGPKCRKGYAQLLTMGVANVVTDLLLVIFPIPIILRSQMTVKRKLQLVFLFGGSLLPAVLTLYRMPNIIERNGLQRYRSLWASVEILLATTVANALVLGSFVRDRGVKKAKWKLGSISDNTERTMSRRGTAVQHWGSDEDLVRDMGLGVVPELRGASKMGVPRPAPMAISDHKSGKKPVLNENWRFPSPTTGDAESEGSDTLRHPGTGPPSGQVTPTPKRTVSFFDVGGLLDDDQASQSRGLSLDGDTVSLVPTRMSDSSSISPSNTRKGSAVFLHDVGGLLSVSPPQKVSPPQNSRRSPRYTRSGNFGIELESIPQERSPHRPRRPSGNDQNPYLPRRPSENDRSSSLPRRPSGNGELPYLPRRPSGNDQPSPPRRPSPMDPNPYLPRRPSENDRSSSLPRRPVGNDQHPYLPRRQSGNDQPSPPPPPPRRPSGNEQLPYLPRKPSGNDQYPNQPRRHSGHNPDEIGVAF